MPTEQTTVGTETQNATNYPPKGGNFATAFPDGAVITGVVIRPSPLKENSTFGIVSVAGDEKTYTVSGVFARLVTEAVVEGRHTLPAKVRAKTLPPDGIKYKYRAIVPEWMD